MSWNPPPGSPPAPPPPPWQPPGGGCPRPGWPPSGPSGPTGPSGPFGPFGPPPKRSSRRSLGLTVAGVVVLAAAAIGIGVTLGNRGDSHHGASPLAAPRPAPRPAPATTFPASTAPSARSHSSGSQPTGAQSPAPNPTGSHAIGRDCTAPRFEQSEMLAAELSAVLQHHDESGFLALATNPTTRATMRLWWDNVDAMGFTYGSAMASDANGSGGDHIDIAIGWHSPLDGSSTSADGKLVPNSPMTWYELTTAPGPQCEQRIDDWQGLSNAPWDAGYRLTVVKTAHSIVAGPASAAARIRRVSGLAEKAAQWDFSFFRANNGQRYLDHLHQRGFLILVPGPGTTATRWFQEYRRGGPSGWITKPGRYAGLTFPLRSPQPPLRTSLPAGAPAYDDQYDSAGGARIVIGRLGTDENDLDLEGTLVHEFVHDLLSTYNASYTLGGAGVDAAATEGVARLIETYFHDSPACYCKDKQGDLPRALPHLKPVLRTHFASFTGRYPTNDQIYGNAQLANYYYDLSATTFDYLVYKYGVAFALQSAVDCYVQGGGPFSGVVTKVTGSKITFGNPKVFERRWAAWLRSEMR